MTMTAERAALLVRASHIEARRQEAEKVGDIDAMRYCEAELLALWRQWLYEQPKTRTAKQLIGIMPQ